MVCSVAVLLFCCSGLIYNLLGFVLDCDLVFVIWVYTLALGYVLSALNYGVWLWVLAGFPGFYGLTL